MVRSKIKVRDMVNWILVALFGLSFILPIFKMQVNPYLLVFISLISIVFGARRMDNYTQKQCLILFFFVMYGMISVLYNSGGLGGIYSIVSGCVLFLASREINFSRKQMVYIIVCLLLLNLYWTIQSPGWYDLFFYNQWKGDGTVTNSNGVGKYICYSAILLFIFLGQSKNRKLKILRWILIGTSVWGIYNVRARISLLVLCAFVLLNAIFSIKKNKKNIIKYLFVIAIAAEALFPFIYLGMYQMGIGTDIQMFGLAEKGLYSGRQKIWMKAIEGMNSVSDWLLGVGSKQDYWEGNVLNMHNNFMNLLVVVGIIGTIFYIVFLYNLIIKKYDVGKKYNWQNQIMLFFIVVLIEGCTDITVFYNQFNIYIYLPLGLACSRKVEYEKIQDNFS